MAGLPPAGSVLKPMAKFLQQARQVERVEPAVAHYLRLYALQMGMKLPGRTAEDTKYLGEVMALVERSAGLELVKQMSKDDARAKCETFALQVFSHGDDEDRAGQATKSTALTFHAAYVLLECCRQFGPLASDIEEKLKYAIVKAADINKALKEGRKPKAGPLNEPSEEELLAGLGGDVSAPAAASSGTGLGPGEAQSRFGGAAAASLPYGGDSHPNMTAGAPPFNPNALAAAAASFSASASSFPSLAGHSDFATAPPHDDYAASALPAAAASAPSASAPPPAGATLPWKQNAAASSSAAAPHAGAGGPSAAFPSSSTSSSASGNGSGAWPSSRTGSSSSSGPGQSPSPFSPEGRAARAAAGGVSHPAFSQRDPRRSEALREGERLIKHALSSVVFSDVDTACQKIREALALMEPFQTTQQR